MHKIYDPDHYKVIFFSSAPIGVPFLHTLNQDPRFELVGVVTQCDKPAGRGMQICECIIRQEAKSIVPKDTNTPTKFLLLHGRWEDGNENRFGRLKDNLEKQGHTVFNPDLPNTQSPKLEEQLADIKKYIDQLDETSIIIGHSIWCILAQQAIIQYKKKVRAIINIGPASEHNTTPATQKALSIAPELSAFVQKKIDFDELKKYVNTYISYLSQDDLYIEYTRSKAFFEEHMPDGTIRTFTKHGHFNQVELPEILEDIDELLLDASSSKPARPAGGLHAVKFIQTPTKLNPEKSEEGREFTQRIKDQNPDFLVVIAYGKIIPQAILDIPKFGAINVHGSLLPKYRWASPIQSVLLHNEKETGITIMNMDAGMDTWAMIDTFKFPLPREWTAQDIIQEIQNKWPQVLNDTLRKYAKGMLGPQVQDEKQASYCSKIEKESWQINLYGTPLQEVYNKYRAFFLRPKIYFIHKGKRVIIEKISVNKENPEYLQEPICSAKHNLNPAIQDILIKPEGKKAMQWKEFYNGYLK